MQPLRREVEAPRRAAGLWAPIAALLGASAVTLIAGIAVTARPPCRPRAAPTVRVEPVAAPVIVEVPADPDSPCGQRVWRATPDGEAEQFEDCAQQGGRGLGSRGSADGKIVRK